MPIVYKYAARNVSEMLRSVFPFFFDMPDLVMEVSRNGPVLRFPGPVALTFRKPLECVCFSPERDANPFFHFMEALWMLAGRNDVAFLDFYNSQMKQYSDDGQVFNAAYGYRLRHHFGFDQLQAIIDELKTNPYSRQLVAQLWDPADLGKQTKDKACNLCMVFAVREGRLDMTVYNRSNDAVLGTISGANTVHMSFFLRYVAEKAGLTVGEYHQIANNLHVYSDHPKTKLMMKEQPTDRYERRNETAGHLMVDYEYWDEQLCDFLRESEDGNIVLQRSGGSVWLYNVAIPLHNAFVFHKLKQPIEAANWASSIAAWDWREACIEWLNRRNAAKGT